MCPLLQRQQLLPLILEAQESGARLRPACAVVGISLRTWQRWNTPAAAQGDRRVRGLRAPVVPHNKFTPVECERVLSALNSPQFKDLPPSQVVPRLADQGSYLGSESTLYRLLRSHGQLHHRGLERAAQKRHKPRALVATRPNQVYCWDITYLPASVRGEYFYLYAFVDLYSRKIVGWQVFDSECATRSSELLQDICQREAIEPDQLTVHSDNGGPMRGQTMVTMMQTLGVAQTRSRPSVSNDNPYAEAMFRTLKYRPALPVARFENIQAARRWAEQLMRWYNEEHRHGAIRYVTPNQRHSGVDKALLKNRAKVYEKAKNEHPNRWSTKARNWTPIEAVHLNPDKTEIRP